MVVGPVCVVVVVDVVVVPVVLVVGTVGIVVSPTGAHTHAFGPATQTSPGAQLPKQNGGTDSSHSKPTSIVVVVVDVEVVVVLEVVVLVDVDVVVGIIVVVVLQPQVRKPRMQLVPGGQSPSQRG